MEYLFTLFFVAFGPLITIAIYKPARDVSAGIIKSVSIVAPFWIILDIFQTKYGWWSFDYSRTLGINLFELPLEEILFFFVVPFSTILFWVLLKKLKI